jgi:glycosyltransferase involved in cell wall biosynthesis
MTVSVIIPNYNHAKYLSQRIESILNQTYSDFEVIILDDCSADNSREIIEDYASRFPVISCFFNETNSGSTFKQWDLGVNKSKGEFIWIAESDDFADPTFLEKTMALMIDHENTGLVYCNSKELDEQKETDHLASEWKIHLNSSKWMNSYTAGGKDEIRECLYRHNTINNVSGVLFRKNKYTEAGYADHNMKFCGDWFLYIRILLISDLAYIPEPLSTYRTHEYSSVNRYFRNRMYLKEVLRIYLYLLKHIRLTPGKIFLMSKNLLVLTCVRVKYIFSVY